MPERAAHNGKRPGGGRPRIDWISAFEHFVSDPTRTYGDVAKTFGVSDTSVRNHARPGADFPEGWDRRRGELLKRALAKAEGRAIKSFEERQRDTIRVSEKLRKRVLDAPADDIALDTAIRRLPAYAKLEQLFAGEATDRPDLGEVQAVILAVIKVAGRRVPREEREVFLAELDEATGGLLELDPGEAA